MYYRVIVFGKVTENYSVVLLIEIKDWNPFVRTQQ